MLGKRSAQGRRRYVGWSELLYRERGGTWWLECCAADSLWVAIGRTRIDFFMSQKNFSREDLSSRAENGPKPRASWSQFFWRMSRGRVLLIGDRIDPQPRFGYGKPPERFLAHRMDEKADVFAERLEEVVSLRESLAEIPVLPVDDASSPHWNNPWFPPLDAAVLYCVIARRQPRLFVEIGSGHSTKFARRAIEDSGARTRIESIDPAPRAEIDAICDVISRSPLECIDLARFENLDEGDVLFVDSSHRLLMGSDVAVIFMEILPRLKPGVLVHFHDIWLPYDYPPRWRFFHFSEQYILGAVLVAAPERYEIWMPNRYVHESDRLSGILNPLWSDERLAGVRLGGAGSFWCVVR